MRKAHRKDKPMNNNNQRRRWTTTTKKSTKTAHRATVAVDDVEMHNFKSALLMMPCAYHRIIHWIIWPFKWRHFTDGIDALQSICQAIYNLIFCLHWPMPNCTRMWSHRSGECCGTKIIIFILCCPYSSFVWQFHSVELLFRFRYSGINNGKLMRIEAI